MDSDQLIPEVIQHLFAKDKVAVIVIDKQASYFDSKILQERNMTTDPASLERIDKFIEFCRGVNVPLVWTQMTEDVDTSPENIRIKMSIDKANNQPLIKAKQGSAGFDFVGLQPTETEVVIQKNTYNSFGAGELEAQLKSMEVSSVVLIGGFGSRCVLGTAYGANAAGYHVWVPEDVISNPDQYSSELPFALRIIDAILGFTYYSSNLIRLWQ